MDAETAYLFRHALLRDAAYQLQLPGERARLHALALASIEQTLAPLGQAALDAAAEDLAHHARQAALGRGQDDMAAKEAEYLWRAARHLERAFHIDRAVQLYERLAGHAHATELRKAEALQAAGAALATAGRLTLAEPWLVRARQAAEQCGAKNLAARSLCSLGLLLTQLGRSSEAEVALVAARPMVEASGDQELSWMLQHNEAILFHHLGRNSDAEAGSRRACAVATAVGESRWLAAALVTSGVICKHTGRLEEAERYYRQALDLCRQGRLPIQELSTRYNLFGLLVDSARYDEATAEFSAIMNLCAETGARRMEGLAIGNFAILRARLGFLDESYRLLMRSVSLAREAGNRVGEAASLGNLGCNSNTEGRFSDAERLLSEALEIHRQVQNRRFLGAHGAPRAVALLGLGRRAEAERQWREALSIIRSLPDPLLLQAQIQDMHEICRKYGLEPLPAEG